MQGMMCALDVTKKNGFVATYSIAHARVNRNSRNTSVVGPESSAHGANMLKQPRASKTYAGMMRSDIPPSSSRTPRRTRSHVSARSRTKVRDQRACCVRSASAITGQRTIQTGTYRVIRTCSRRSEARTARRTSYPRRCLQSVTYCLSMYSGDVQTIASDSASSVLMSACQVQCDAQMHLRPSPVPHMHCAPCGVDGASRNEA